VCLEINNVNDFDKEYDYYGLLRAQEPRKQKQKNYQIPSHHDAIGGFAFVKLS